MSNWPQLPYGWNHKSEGDKGSGRAGGPGRERPPRREGGDRRLRDDDLPRELAETVDFLVEVLADYEKLVTHIGENGLAAPMLLYYRDEVQETLDYLTEEKSVETREYWQKVVELDNVLRAHAQDFVDEVGHVNFKQYQIINDPPREYWWWYLNRETKSPPPPPAFWQFWKKGAEPPAVEE